MLSLRQQSIVAVGSSAALSLVGDIVRLVTMMVLARLLTPEDYGNFGLASSVMFWVGAAGFENFAPNLLRHRGREGQIGTYLLFGLILQSCLLAVGLVVAAFLYFWLEYELVAALLAVGLLFFPVKVPQQIEYQLLQREFNWRRLRLVELATLLSASGLSCLLAYIGAGPFALIAPTVLEPLPFAVLFFASRQFKPLRFDRELLKSIQTFGWPMVGGSISWRTRELISSWAVGAVLGAATLGVLGRAMGLAGLVLGRFSGRLPLLSYRSSWLRTRSCTPVAGGQFIIVPHRLEPSPFGSLLDPARGSCRPPSIWAELGRSDRPSALRERLNAHEQAR